MEHCVCVSLLSMLFCFYLYFLLYCFSFDSLSFLSLFFSASLTLPLFFCVSFILYFTFSILFIYTPRYHSLLDRAEKRRRCLLQRYNEFFLAYEGGDMLDWIQKKKAENTGVELEDVWELQKKFDEFQTVRKRHHFFWTMF